VKKATITDVAEFAGVSKSTVSKYLNDIPYVSPETRKKIEKAIEELSFQPNSLARGLVSKSTGLIGLVIADFEIPINTELIKSIEVEATAHDYNLVLVSTNDNQRNEQRIQKILEGKYQHLDGLILANIREDRDELLKLQKVFENIVLVHRHIPEAPTDYVVVDGYAGGRLAAEYLIRLGHRKIAIISGPMNIYQFRERVRGFKEVMEEHNLLQESITLEYGQTIEDGYQAAEKLIIGPNSPTAIFATSDTIALGVLDAARHYGLSIPGELSVIGFDNIFFSKLARIPLTTIDTRIKDMGSQAVTLLIKQIKQKANQINRIQLQPSLIVRESCGKIGSGKN
jgi:DNA-binding LacI/PurR family transcriptional regulator